MVCVENPAEVPRVAYESFISANPVVGMLNTKELLLLAELTGQKDNPAVDDVNPTASNEEPAKSSVPDPFGLVRLEPVHCLHN